MPWCIDYTGRPSRVAEALESHTEYSHAMVPLADLVRLIDDHDPAPGAMPTLVRVRASGGVLPAADGERPSASVTVSIEPIYTRLV